MDATLKRALAGPVGRLALAKNIRLEDGALDVYVELLADVPPRLVSEACRQLATSETFGMPTVGAIRIAVDECQRVQVEQVKATALLRAAEEDRSTWVHCRVCNDDPGAWIPCFCVGRGIEETNPERLAGRVRLGETIEKCDRMQPHGSHTYVRRCQCHMSDWREEARARLKTQYGNDRREDRPKRSQDYR